MSVVYYVFVDTMKPNMFDRMPTLMV